MGELLIGHLTDTHVVERGGALFDIDTVAHAQAAVAELRDLHPDFVLVTGDVTAHGTAAEYEVARDVFERLGVPYRVVPGNHDRRAPLHDGFGDAAPLDRDGFVQHVTDIGPVRVIGLDTLDEGHEDGLLSAERLAWLDAALEERPERPTLVGLHHPPFATGIWWMDETGLRGAAELAEIVARHPQVGLVACGHVHRCISGVVAGRPVAIGPSTAFEVHLDLDPGDRARVALAPPAYQVHRFARGAWVTHSAVVDGRALVDIGEYDARAQAL